jgi:hypothetical protein
MTRVKNRTKQINNPLPRVGKIRIGEKRTNNQGKEYPTSLDYFKATGPYAGLFNEVYGEKPNQIQIIFITDDDSVSCNEVWEGREKKTGNLAGTSDGESFQLWNYESGKYEVCNDKSVVESFTKEHEIQWSIILTLNFIIPAIKGVFGMWQLQTKGTKSSIENIVNTYDSMKQHAGTICNIPFDLQVQKVTGQKPGQKRKFPVISLVPHISAENVEMVRNFLESGGQLDRMGMLTDDKISQLQLKDRNA